MIGFISAVIVVLCLSCATDQYTQVDSAVAAGRYDRGAAIIEENKKGIYRDAILYYLDKGMLEHYAGNYLDSIELLQNGEEAIKEAFTKSITQEIGSFIINDNTKDYSGEDYEDMYLNVFNALNYYHKNDISEALVEIRRMNEKLQELAIKYDQLTTSLEQEAIKNGAAIPESAHSSVDFANSALARYLGMLFFRANGKYDDARIDYEQLKIAFNKAPAIYTNPVPGSIDEELTIPAGKARLNVIGFAGLSPIKEERVERIYTSDVFIKIALPVIEERRSQVDRVSLVFEGETTLPPLTLELLENISAVAKATFTKKVPSIYIKTILRTMAKSGLASFLGEKEEEGEGYSYARLAMQAFTEVSEQADTRLSRYFPSKAYIGGITLEPGVYSFSINYYASDGRLIQSEKRTMDIQAHNLNLVEALCLK
ncbi:MAG: hypothetical protein LBO67_05590 [Spirochaetaceae bacterium]|jgi:hypothetical protein|nr:hypothetical protein [Spirochaetaceae bacterium]